MGHLSVVFLFCSVVNGNIEQCSDKKEFCHLHSDTCEQCVEIDSVTYCEKVHTYD